MQPDQTTTDPLAELQEARLQIAAAQAFADEAWERALAAWRGDGGAALYPPKAPAQEPQNGTARRPVAGLFGLEDHPASVNMGAAMKAAARVLALEWPHIAENRIREVGMRVAEAVAAALNVDELVTKLERAQALAATRDRRLDETRRTVAGWLRLVDNPHDPLSWLDIEAAVRGLRADLKTATVARDSALRDFAAMERQRDEARASLGEYARQLASERKGSETAIAERDELAAKLNAEMNATDTARADVERLTRERDDARAGYGQLLDALGIPADKGYDTDFAAGAIRQMVDRSRQHRTETAKYRREAEDARRERDAAQAAAKSADIAFRGQAKQAVEYAKALEETRLELEVVRALVGQEQAVLEVVEALAGELAGKLDELAKATNTPAFAEQAAALRKRMAEFTAPSTQEAGDVAHD